LHCQCLVLAEWHLNLRYKTTGRSNVKSAIMVQWGQRFSFAPCSRILLGSALV
jgi:hypothetical protein